MRDRVKMNMRKIKGCEAREIRKAALWPKTSREKEWRAVMAIANILIWEI